MGYTEIDQELISVRALVFYLAQLLTKKSKVICYSFLNVLHLNAVL